MTDRIETPLARTWRPSRGQLIKLVSVGLFAALGTFAVVRSIVGEKKTAETAPAAAPAAAIEEATPAAAIQGLLGDEPGTDSSSQSVDSERPAATGEPAIKALVGSAESGKAPTIPIVPNPAPQGVQLNLVGAERKAPSTAPPQTSSGESATAFAKPIAPALQAPAGFTPPDNRKESSPAATPGGAAGFKLVSEGSANAQPPVVPISKPEPARGAGSPTAAQLGDQPESRPTANSAGSFPSNNTRSALPTAGPESAGTAAPAAFAPVGAASNPPPADDGVNPNSNSLRDPVAGASPNPTGSSPSSSPSSSSTESLNDGQRSAPSGTAAPPTSFGDSATLPVRRPEPMTLPAIVAPPPSGLPGPGSGSSPSAPGGQTGGGGPVAVSVPPGVPGRVDSTGPAMPAPPGSSSPVSLPPVAVSPGGLSSPPAAGRSGVELSSGDGPARSSAGSGGFPPVIPPSSSGLGSGGLPGQVGPSSPNPPGLSAGPAREGAVAAGGLSAAGGGLPGKSELEGEQIPALSIEKVAPREIQIDQPTDFRIIVRNVGRVVANGVRVTDQVPRGAQFVKAVPEASRTAAGALVWELGSLKPGEERSVVLTLQPRQTGEIGSVAEVTFATPASMRVLVTKPQLAVEHSGPAKVMIGDRVPLAITVRNLGNGPAKEVILQEQVPPQLKFSEEFNELEYEIGTLAPGESKKVNLNLSAAQIGRFRNTILVSGTGGLHAEHQIDMEVVAPQLQLTSEGPSRRYLKRNATHLFSVRNSGTAIATNLDLVTKLPKGVRFVSANNQGQYDPGSHAVYWSLDRLNVGQAASVQLTTTPEEAGEQNLEFIATADLNQKSSFRQPLLVEDLLELFFEVDDVDDVIEVGSETRYRLRLINQGTVTATNLQLSFSADQGIRPVSVDNRLAAEVRGQEVVFAPIAEIRPGQELVTYVTAVGAAPGEHRIVVRLRADQREMNVSKEESTRVYADR